MNKRDAITQAIMQQMIMELEPRTDDPSRGIHGIGMGPAAPIGKVPGDKPRSGPPMPRAYGEPPPGFMGMDDPSRGIHGLGMYDMPPGRAPQEGPYMPPPDMPPRAPPSAVPYDTPPEGRMAPPPDMPPGRAYMPPQEGASPYDMPPRQWSPLDYPEE